MENVIYNELRMRGYSVDVGVIPIAERNQEGKVIRNSLKLILYAILVHPDTISSRHTRCQMKRTHSGNQTVQEIDDFLQKDCYHKRYCAALL